MNHDECTLYLNNDRTIFFRQAEKGKITIEPDNYRLTPNELLAVTVISETMRCLAEGRDLNLYFNPTEKPSDRTTLMRCMWERTGRLKIIGEAKDKFIMCNTLEEALAARRMFTVYKSLLRDLPSKRPPLATKTPVRK